MRPIHIYLKELSIGGNQLLSLKDKYKVYKPQEIIYETQEITQSYLVEVCVTINCTKSRLIRVSLPYKIRFRHGRCPNIRDMICCSVSNSTIG